MAEPGRLLKGIPITDNHVHFRPDGRMREAIQEFRRLGGHRMVLVHSPYEDLLATRVGGFAPGYRRTLSLADRARQWDVEVLVALGPHPVELVHLQDKLGLQAAVEMVRTGLEEAQRHVQEGRAVAIGEIGRPHFPVSKDAWRASNHLILYGMELAREANCAVILHTEEASLDLFRELAAMADRARIPRQRVIKHYSGPFALKEETRGIYPSVIAKGDNILKAARRGRRFLMETDYLDDPRRPGAVLGLGTVPRRCARLLVEGVLSREEMHRMHEDNLREAYGETLTGG